MKSWARVSRTKGRMALHVTGQVSRGPGYKLLLKSLDFKRNGKPFKSFKRLTQVVISKNVLEKG